MCVQHTVHCVVVYVRRCLALRSELMSLCATALCNAHLFSTRSADMSAVSADATNA
jgi:hypothetical protein